MTRLDAYKTIPVAAGATIPETRSVSVVASSGLTEMSWYCLEELGLCYCLLPESQHHISARQVFTSPNTNYVSGKPSSFPTCNT